MRSLTRLLLVAPLALAAGCGSDGDSSDSDTAETVETDAATEATEPADAGDGAAEDAEPDDADDADDEAAAPGGTGGGGATLTLENGETFEFPTVLCTLEPQMAAGSEILFTATSYDDPGLDITQFGDEGTITGIATISVYDGNFETLWEANSMLGSSVELTVDGSTIRGTGSFVERDDFGGETVEGEVVANC
jgi:hypothetical protein